MSIPIPLAADVNDLIAAVIDALDVPTAARSVDDAAADTLIMMRSTHVMAALRYLQAGRSTPLDTTASIRACTEQSPVTYEPLAVGWLDIERRLHEGRLLEQRHQLNDPPEPNPAAYIDTVEITAVAR